MLYLLDISEIYSFIPLSDRSNGLVVCSFAYLSHMCPCKGWIKGFRVPPFLPTFLQIEIIPVLLSGVACTIGCPVCVVVRAKCWPSFPITVSIKNLRDSNTRRFQVQYIGKVPSAGCSQYALKLQFRSLVFFHIGAGHLWTYTFGLTFFIPPSPAFWSAAIPVLGSNFLGDLDSIVRQQS